MPTKRDDAAYPHHFTLVCQPCGASIVVDASRPPQFGFELVQAAQAVGWVGGFAGDRAAVFCCDDCMKAATTKVGGLRRDLGRGRRAAAVEVATP